MDLDDKKRRHNLFRYDKDPKEQLPEGTDRAMETEAQRRQRRALIEQLREVPEDYDPTVKPKLKKAWM